MAQGRHEVIAGVSLEVVRFIRNRRKKLEGLRHDSMAVNPFLNPLIMELNGYDGDVAELTDFLVGGHLLDGHATGFGKLVDERIVPNVFGTTKLTAAFRKANPPFDDPMCGVIDHIFERSDGRYDLLPLKAGRWSIQLGQALNMNRSFAQLIDARDEGRLDFNRIVIGVLYGQAATLTDKFAIARGIGPHDLVDITADVEIRAGRDFWTWLNDGAVDTQDWVMAGFLDAMKVAHDELGSAAGAVEAYSRSYQTQLERHKNSDDTIDWYGLLKEVNG